MAVFSFLPTTPQGIHACSCAPQPVLERFDDAFVVFSGTVVAVDGFASATFQIRHPFKGELDDEVVVLNRGGGGTCGLNVHEGSDYLIFAGADSINGEVWPGAGLCSGSSRLFYALNGLLLVGQAARGGPDYQVVVLLFSENGDDGEPSASGLEVGLRELLSANLAPGEPPINASQIVVPYVKTDTTFALCQIFDAADKDSAPSSARLVSVLAELVNDDLIHAEAAFAEHGFGTLVKLIADPATVHLPHGSDGEPAPGWFTRTGNKVGFDDFYAFADVFGTAAGDPDFFALFDISGPDSDPDGFINYHDFFLFADNFGKTIVYPGFPDYYDELSIP